MSQKNGANSGNKNDDDFDMALNSQLGFSGLDALFTGNKTEHAEDAVDFSDEEELAEEEIDTENKSIGQSVAADDDDKDGNEADDESEDDLFKELQAEAMEGVEDEDELAEIMPSGIFNGGLAVPGGGLHDLGFENDTFGDGQDDDIDMHNEMGLASSTKKPRSDSIEEEGEEEDFSDIDMDDEDSLEKQKLLKEKIRLEKEERERRKNEKLLQIYYPSFKKGKPIKMQSLFPIEPINYTYQEPLNAAKPLIPTKIRLEPQIDQRKIFRLTHKQLQLQQKQQAASNTTTNGNSSSNNYIEPAQRIIEVSTEWMEELKPKTEVVKKPKETIESFDKDLILSIADWDDKCIFMGEPDSDSESVNIQPLSKRLKLENMDYDDWDADDDMIFEGKLELDSLNLKLDMNDTNMLFTNIDDGKQKAGQLNQATLPTTERMLELRFSISNDKEYDILKEFYQTKVRATIGNLSIDHSLPAIRLQSPYYKVNPSKKEIRYIHRQGFSVRPNTTMVFSKIKNRKKKKDKGKEVKELFQKSNDLTLGDSAHFCMLEYSEEMPAVLNNFGMGSKLINYYRKKGEDDNSRPKLSVGETHVLGVEDRSPFWNFGYVEPGNIVPTLYNRMVRAPVFKHDPLTADFLLVRSSGGGFSPRYFLRSINHVFTVGQTLPVVDVPGPHSRKVTATSKNRLRMIAFRILNSTPQNRLVVKDIAVHFPDQNDMQNRQRLKEFMEYQRQGEDQGFWKVKSNEKLVPNEEVRNMITPEDISLLSSMKSGQLLLDDYESLKREKSQSTNGKQDGNNSNTSNGNNDNEASGNTKKKQEKDSNASDEPLLVQLAPWNTTRNFINATQGKAMLQIHGEGDPSGKGEAVSFLRTSMKGGFKAANSTDGTTVDTPGSVAAPSPAAGGNSSKSQDKKLLNGHTYNVAVQQKLYDEEISKVWYAQQKSLSRPRISDKPRDVTQEELNDDIYIKRANSELTKEIVQTETTKPRMIRITRMVRNDYGILERKTEIIDDPKIVELYVKRKRERLVEDSSEIEPDKFILTNDAEENAKVKKKLEEELARLEKKQEKKKKKSPGITAANIDSEGRISGKGIGKGKSTSRKCATCGSLGHIRTNKTCPLYYTIYNKSNPNYVPGSETSIQPEYSSGSEALAAMNSSASPSSAAGATEAETSAPIPEGSTNV